MADELRRSQIITTFGIGSIVDLKYCSAVMKSPDVWQPALKAELEAKYRIDDPRLSTVLGTEYFVQPPSKADSSIRVPLSLFPRMLYCPRCKTLMNVKYWFKEGLPSPWDLTCSCNSDKFRRSRARLLPSRFIVICPKGHMDDFPYDEWVHYYRPCSKSSTDGYSPQFRYYAIGGGASLGDIKIQCKNCGKSRSLAGGITGKKHAELRCSGNRPEHFAKRPQPESCNVTGEHLHFVLRNASNVYFPRIYSSLLIPPFSQELCERIQRTTEFRALRNLAESGAPIVEQMRAFYIGQWSESLATPGHLVEKAVDSMLSAKSGTKTIEQLKVQEFSAFTESEYRSDPNFKIQERPTVFLNRFKVGRLRKCVRLREVRVLAGYSRVRPLDFDISAALNNPDPAELTHMSGAFKSVAPKTQKDWLPGIEVFGEGIFISFRDEQLSQFEAEANSVRRLAIMRSHANEFSLESGFKLSPINARLVALHTFSHVLLKRIAFESGYALPSLRERIFCNCEPASPIMNGLLIYTADVDTEGTLGGLSRLADDKVLFDLIQNALLDSDWCSSDPVCRESTGQGLGSLNLAACHSCCLLPETCCELGNRFLDRVLLEACFKETSS